MTWEQIAELHRDGFEIGNHTGNHASITKKNVVDLAEQLEIINRRVRNMEFPDNQFRLSGQRDLA